MTTIYDTMANAIPLTQNEHLIRAILRINQLYNHNSSLPGVTLRTKVQTLFFIYDVRRGFVTSLSKKHLNSFLLHTHLECKIHREGPFTFCLINRDAFNAQSYEPQIHVPILSGLFKSVVDKLLLVKGAALEWGSDDMNAFVINLLTILVDAFGFKSFTNWISILMRIYALILNFAGFKSRHLNRYEGQVDFTDVASTLILYGLPDYIIKSVRDFQTLVGIRIQTGSFITTALRKLIHIVKSLLSWAAEKTGKVMFTTVHDFVDKHFAFVLHMDFVEQINEVYAKYVKNSQVILDVTYRNLVLAINQKTETDLEFSNFLSRPEMRAYKELYTAFKNNIVKYVKTFTTSARKEPVCVVFEGPPGSRKSAVMNQIVQLCKTLDRSVITHNVPSVTAGKDFYDDYENQDVFVSDDIGQMDNSQWRVIINAVAPVKMPLECAAAEKKNTKFFNSNLLLGTTNRLMDIQTFTTKDCISDKEALFRRIHVFKFASPTTYEITYHKFDYQDTHLWLNEFIGGMKKCGLPTSMKGDFENRGDTLKIVEWIYKVIATAEAVNAGYAEASNLSDAELLHIKNKLYPYEDAPLADATFEGQGIIADVFNNSLDTAGYYTSVITGKALDWSEYLMTSLGEITTSILTGLTSPPALGSDNVCFTLMLIGQAITASIFLYSLFSTSQIVPQDNLADLIKHKDLFSRQFYEAQSEISPDFVSVSKNHCFFTSVTSTVGGKRVSINTQCTMSGRYILINDHAVGADPILNIYKDWDAFKSNNLMFNNLPAIVYERLLTEDIAILKVEVFPVTPMKVFRWPQDHDVDFFKAKELFCINSDLVKPMKNRCNCTVNSFIVKYSREKDYVMLPGETLSYDLSAPGLCGSLLVSEAGIPIGHHIAGNVDTKEGVIKLWTRQTRDKIKAIFAGKESQYTPIYKPLTDFSGMRYMQTDLKTSRCLNASGYRQTPLHHIRDDVEFDDMITKLQEQPFVIPKQLKAPANLFAFGNKTLKEMAKKSYRPIPMIDPKEIIFAKKCIASQLTHFSKISEHEAAFGTTDLTEMNRKSVNGYDYEKDKKQYFDYEKKVIKPEFKRRIADFKSRAVKDELLVSDILCVEALKDELRPMEKVNKPRAYRILPLHHTFLLKQYIARLFIHVKKNMWTNGVAIGMNPYLDFDELYRRMKTKHLYFDGDFEKYDGSAPSELQDAIADVVMSFFEGSKDDNIIFRILLNSCIRSFVLTNEELFLTTHSLPSGCWVTAFFNSLLNKMLTAICLIRNKPDATVEEWASVMDNVLGDDKLVGVPKNLIEVVNALRMKDVAESLGMGYTDARKGPITSPGKSLDECQFLKRTFVYNSDLQKRVGALDINTIVETLRFFDSGKEYEEAMDGKMTAIQFELFLYGNHGDAILQFLKNRAVEKEITFKDFDKAHIMKSMTDPQTYTQLLAIQGKYNPG